MYIEKCITQSSTLLFPSLQVKIIFSLHTHLLYLCKSADYIAPAVARFSSYFPIYVSDLLQY